MSQLTEHPGPQARAARGKAARGAVPRTSHATWEAPADRRDPVDVLLEQAATRLPGLVPLRHGRMLGSPFAFFRGAAAIMAADLAASPATGLVAQLCGDAHLSNFGAFAAPDRHMVFDLNDFDETAPGPFEWDVKRLAASVAIAGRELGLTTRRREDAVRTAVRSYRVAMRRFAEMRHLDVWYSRLDLDAALAKPPREIGDARRRSLARTIAKARTKDSLRAFDKLTREVDGAPRIVSDPPIVVPIRELLGDDGDGRDIEGELHELLDVYRATLEAHRRHLIDGFRAVDLARKVVGVGSVGTRAWIVLLLGRDERDPLFLQIKEAEASVLEPHLGPAAFENHGQRVVEGQRLMQAAGDVLLGWMTTTGLDGRERDFYVRQLWDCKRSAEIELMDPEGLRLYAELCGGTLARAHARSGDRVGIAAYLGSGETFDAALVDFAEAYADQNAADHAAFANAAATGRVEVAEG